MKKFLKWLGIGFIALIVLSFFLGNEDTQPTTSTPTTSSEETKTAAEPQQDKEFKVGETIQLGDNKLTVNEVQKSNGGNFNIPNDGQEFVIVKVTIENAGKNNIPYNPFDFKMSNSQGQITNNTFIVDQGTALQSGELAPNGKVSGTIAFEQPKDDEKLQLQYQPGFWSSKTIKVNLQ